MRKRITAFLTAITFVLGNFTWFPVFSTAAEESGTGYWKLVNVKNYYGDTLVEEHHTYTWEMQDGWDTEHWKYHCQNLTTSGNSGEHPDKDIGVNGVVHDHTGETMDHYFYATPLKETYLPGETAEVDVRYHFETTVPATCKAILWGTGMPSVGETVDEAWEGCGFKIDWDNREGVEYVRRRNANNPGEVGLYSKTDGETRRNLDNEGTASFQMPDADNGDYWGKVFVGYTVHAGNSDGYTTVFTYEWVKGLSVSIQPKSYYLIDEKADIPITITGDIPGDAWITFVPSDVEHTEEEGDKHNIGCVWLKDITDGFAHLTVPSKPGKYDVRVYDGDSAATAKEIAYQTVDVLYSDLKAELSADVKTVKPGEPVKVSVNILSGTCRKDAWVSFVPSDVEHTEKNSDDYNKDYAYYPDFKDGYVTLTAPRDEGSWDIRLFDGEDGAYASEIDYITLTVSENAEPTEPEQLEVLASNYNISAVTNQPTKDSTFTVDKECTAKYLNTYHWNHAKGQTPGTITLLEDGKELGTWQTYGTDGQGGVKNAVWNVRINPITLKPGHTYQIVDSDPETWAQNSGSGGAGFFEVQGLFTGDLIEPTKSGTETTTHPTTEPTTHPTTEPTTHPTTEPTEPKTDPTEPTEPEQLEVLASNYNISGVSNQPTKDSTFTVDKECTAKYLNTYHWNHGKGQTPGTITLLEDGKELGTWQTYGTDGQGGVKNAVWNVRIDPITLKPGHTYQIVDSDPATWAQNGGSGGAGFFEVQGLFGSDLTEPTESDTNPTESDTEPTTHPTTEPTEPTTDPTEPSETEALEDLAVNYNGLTVGNQPTKDSTFTVERECTAKYINTYHWNHGKGQTPGTITLLEDGKELGTWQTYGTDGQGGVKNAVWNVYIKPLPLKPGHTYQIVDSDPATWAQNSSTGGSGFFLVQGTFDDEPETPLDLGDVTGDNAINAKDANSVLIAAARLGTNLSSGLTEAQMKAADVNGDDSINAKDASIILLYAAFAGTGDVRPIESLL